MTHKYNQKGMSAILFAMIFTVILSLLAIGFATLVRNDQRQTLDQSLSFQAQYAAETAVNQVATFLKDNPTAIEKTSCDGTNKFEIATNTNVNISCVTWKKTGKNIIFDDVGQQPYASGITVPGGYNKLRITWTADNKGMYASGSFPNNLNGSNYSVIRATYLPNGATDTKQQYYVPTSTGTGSINYPNAGGDADIGYAICDGTLCTMNVNMGPFQDGYISLAALGQTASRVTIEALQGNDVRDIVGAQYSIDATAIAQDVTKRIEVRIPINSQTWRPGFAAMSERMCKDIKIDGDNDASISGDDSCVDLIDPTP